MNIPNLLNTIIVKIILQLLVEHKTATHAVINNALYRSPTSRWTFCFSGWDLKTGFFLLYCDSQVNVSDHLLKWILSSDFFFGFVFSHVWGRQHTSQHNHKILHRQKKLWADCTSRLTVGNEIKPTSVLLSRILPPKDPPITKIWYQDIALKSLYFLLCPKLFLTKYNVLVFIENQINIKPASLKFKGCNWSTRLLS